MYPEAEKGGPGHKSERVELKSTVSFSTKRLQQARSVLRNSRSLAQEVLSGTMPLNDAIAQVNDAEAAALVQARRKERVRVFDARRSRHKRARSARLAPPFRAGRQALTFSGGAPLQRSAARRLTHWSSAWPLTDPIASTAARPRRSQWCGPTPNDNLSRTLTCITQREYNLSG